MRLGAFFKDVGKGPGSSVWGGLAVLEMVGGVLRGWGVPEEVVVLEPLLAPHTEYYNGTMFQLQVCARGVLCVSCVFPHTQSALHTSPPPLIGGVAAPSTYTHAGGSGWQIRCTPQGHMGSRGRAPRTGEEPPHATPGCGGHHQLGSPGCIPQHHTR